VYARMRACDSLLAPVLPGTHRSSLPRLSCSACEGSRLGWSRDELDGPGGGCWGSGCSAWAPDAASLRADGCLPRCPKGTWRRGCEALGGCPQQQLLPTPSCTCCCCCCHRSIV